MRERHVNEVDRALDTGQALILEDEDGICGCSLVYKFESLAADGEEENIYAEIGTMRVTRNGLGLQSVLACFHMVQIYLEDLYDNPQGEIFAVVSKDTASEHILKNQVGMTDWQPPLALIGARGQSGVPFTTNKYVLHAAHESISAAFSFLNDARKSENEFITPKGGQTVLIELGWFKPSTLECGPSG